jgi:hypothetical protein
MQLDSLPVHDCMMDGSVRIKARCRMNQPKRPINSDVGDSLPPLLPTDLIGSNPAAGLYDDSEALKSP